ncbi:MAG: PASTA domain-containing protein [Prevotellaceae bacterium]|jgi:beta-lactam-binding protein with PASTA domain|nr:PASTA domain-containing protein [Prevotellaceae bacterium]
MAKKKRGSTHTTFAGWLRSLMWRAWSNFYIRHLLLAACALLLLLLAINLWLMVYTRHGQANPTPDFTGLSLADAQLLAAQNKLRLQVSDSVFIAHRPRGSVVEQNPHPNVMVKENRTIFLTMNATIAKRVAAPDVVGVSLRQAKSTIEQQGLEVGRLTFAYGFSGNVIGQLYRGRPLSEGDKLTVGSRIDLQVGSAEGEHTAIPQLKGMSLSLARSAIIESSLNVGRVHYDASVLTALDSINAKVYSQNPAPAENTNLAVGALVELYLTVKEERLN